MISQSRQSAQLPPAANSLGEHVARTLRLAVPVMFSRSGALILAVVDSAMTGHAGAHELAYYGLASAPQIFVMLIGLGLLLGTVVLTAQADGAGRPQECGAVWRIALLHGLVYGGLQAVLMLPGEDFLLATGQSQDLAQGGGRVMTMLAIGMPAMLLFVATTMFLEGIGRPLPSLIVMLFANLLNGFLNWLLIFGNWGFPAMGAEGAALATSLARWFMFVAIAGYVILAVERDRYGLSGPIPDGVALARRFRRIGYPMALSHLMESGSFAMMTLFAGLMGPLHVATFQIIMTLIALVFMSALGFSTAASIRVGNAVGRGDPKGIQIAGWTAAGLVICVLAAFTVLFVTLPAPLVAIFTDDPEVAAYTVTALVLAALILIPDGIQAVLLGALRGMTDVWPATLLFFIAFWVIMVPVAYYWGVVDQQGTGGLLKAIALGCLVAAVLLGWRFDRVSRRGLRNN